MSSESGDAFVQRAQQIVDDAAGGKAPAKRENFNVAVGLLMENKDRQTVETLDEIVQATNTRTEKLPQAIFVLTANEPKAGADLAMDVELEINAYWHLDTLKPATHFRVRAELGMPIQCQVEWLSAEAGGRKSGPPASGYSAPARVAGTTELHASIVLTWVDEADAPPGAERHGISLLNTDFEPGLEMLKPGAILDVCEGSRVVAKVHLAKE